MKIEVINAWKEAENYMNAVQNGQDKVQAWEEIVISPYWDKLPAFRDLLNTIPSFHVPCKKAYISSALKDPDVTIQHKKEIAKYFYA